MAIRIVGVDLSQNKTGEIPLTYVSVSYTHLDVANYNQMVLNHSISPLDNPAQIKKLRRTIARMKDVYKRQVRNRMASG